MGVSVQWDDAEKTILRYDYGGKWTVEELYAAASEAKKLIEVEGTQHKIAVIINMQNSSALPASAMTHGKRLMTMPLPNVDFQVVVGANMFVRTLANTATKVYGQFGRKITTQFAQTMDEARSVIAKQRVPQ
jgi:hypothetical protein